MDPNEYYDLSLRIVKSTSDRFPAEADHIKIGKYPARQISTYNEVGLHTQVELQAETEYENKVIYSSFLYKTTVRLNTIRQILSTFEFIDEAQPSPTPTKSAGNSQRFVGEGCKVGGCSSELCLDKDSEGVYSICIYNPVYECYKTARCERQENGECGWSQTEELKACLNEKSNK